MKETTPKVRLIASTWIDWPALAAYVSEVGGDKWLERVQFASASGGHGDLLVEIAGRLCYRSWDVGLNPNVTKVRENSAEYLLNVLKSGHGSVLEHASYSFIFQDVSRVFTHELVRHRAGVAISQESLRYVRLTDIGFRIPAILEDAIPREEIVSLIEHIEEVQRMGGEALDGKGAEALPFHVKKEVTSALRRLAPLGLSTTILWTANLRTLRHVISMRTAKGAEEEIRFVFREVAKTMKDTSPLIFADYEENEEGEYVTPYWKV